MSKVKVQNAGKFTGEYDMAELPYSTDEWHQIKTHTGLRPADFEEAITAGDADVFAALAWVTLVRAGFQHRESWAAIGPLDPYGDLVFDFTDDEVIDQDPPKAAPPPGTAELPPGNVENGQPTGDDLKPSLALLDNDQLATGTQP